MKAELDLSPLARMVADLVSVQVREELARLLEGSKPPEPWLSTDDLSAITKVSPKTIRDWAHQGCPHIRVSKGAHRFRLSEVEFWLSNRRPK